MLGVRSLLTADLLQAVDPATAVFGVEGLKSFGYALYNNGNVLPDEPVMQWPTLQPDLQHVIRPGWAELEPAWIVGRRFEVARGGSR